MFNFTNTDLQRFAVSAAGAIALSAVCVGAAVAPAKAAPAPLTVAEWQQTVADRIDTMPKPRTMPEPSTLTQAAVTAHFNDEGEFAGATLARSSGNRAVDRSALRVAGRIAYPTLPAGLRGTPQDVRMNIYFGSPTTASDYAALRDREAGAMQIAAAKRDGTQVATR
jgi:TonB family protein